METERFATHRLQVLRLFTLAFAFALFSSCRPSSSDSNTVTLQLNWLPDAQHGGYYAALINGHYERMGLEVEILPGGPGRPVIPKVALGRVDFAVVNADQVLMGAAQEAEIVAVMAALQNSPRCIMVHNDAGISSFHELEDLTLAMGEGKSFARYLRSKVPLRNVRIVSYSGTIAKFLLDPHYAQQAYIFSEPVLARRQGADPHCLMVSDLGFNPYTSVLIAARGTLRERPQLVGKFVRASVRGWQDYLRDPAATNEEIHRLRPEMDVASLDEAADTLVDLCLPDGMSRQDMGEMSEARWATLARQLIELGLLPPSASDTVSSVFTVEYLAPVRTSPP